MNLSDNFKASKKNFDLSLAINESHRCLLCYDAPCSNGCPAKTDPGLFIRKLKMRNIKGAIRTIKTNNILGGACGVLCPTASLCEKECSATDLDRPIRIGQIQEALIRHSYQIGFGVLKKQQLREEKIAVVGSGPAGLSCAAELAKDGYSVTIYEAKAKPGGVLRYGVPSYRFPEEFLNKEIEDITALGVKIQCSSPITGNKAAENLLEKGFDAVFLAPGLWLPIRLEEPSGEKTGVFTSTGFLASLREKKYDHLGEFINGKKAAVIGGGSVAIDCAESAVRLGAMDVYLLYRRSFTEMPAEEDEKISALSAGVHFLLLNQPKKYLQDNNGVLKGIELNRTYLCDIDASKRRKPVEIPNSSWVLEVDAVIEAIGAEPASESPEWYPSVKVTDGNLIVVNNDTYTTSKAGIFAGGDIIRGPGLVVQAVQDGKIAAGTIKQYLSRGRQ